HSFEEALDWDFSGKLSLYSTNETEKALTYTPRGFLESLGNNQYEFDFNKRGTGIRTKEPHSYVPKDGLDAFGRITKETCHGKYYSTAYDDMGQTKSQNQRQFEWDPWGRLLKVTDSFSVWEVSYDALGRRLQTRQTQRLNSPMTKTFFYDPEEEFQEIGVQTDHEVFWKFYGPDACDAVQSSNGETVYLSRNAFGELTAVIGLEKTVYNQNTLQPYGPQTTASSNNMLSYAYSLNWHSKSPDATGLIWMGARYYDPQGGRFLSPDPAGYPICLDLYHYANGDPVNNYDPDGRLSIE
ncbi:MAG: RHS repeat-associated core domain-containing protein, partial [Bdellovibrionales bacterium]|nr:RHS repeat-associated core domain-containing protein [Bdellovibrionales bacterium]